MSCLEQNLADFHYYRHYEGLRLLPTVCDSKLIQQTLISDIDNVKDSFHIINISLSLHKFCQKLHSFIEIYTQIHIFSEIESKKYASTINRVC